MGGVSGAASGIPPPAAAAQGSHITQLGPIMLGGATAGVSAAGVSDHAGTVQLLAQRGRSVGGGTSEVAAAVGGGVGGPGGQGLVAGEGEGQQPAEQLRLCGGVMGDSAKMTPKGDCWVLMWSSGAKVAYVFAWCISHCHGKGI
jgi:hypothetical protein